MYFEEEDVRGLEMVTTDEDRVLRGGWTEIIFYIVNAESSWG